LIRSDDTLFNGIFGLFFSKLLRVPLISALWGNPRRIRKDTGVAMMPRLFRYAKIEEYIENIVLKSSNLVISENLENLQYAFDVGVKRMKTQILGLGIAIDKSHLVRPVKRQVRPNLVRNFEGKGKYWICVSRLEPVKMVDHLLEVQKIVLKSCPESKLIIVGEGSLRESLRRQAQHLGVLDSIIFTGSLSQSEISELATLCKLQAAPLCGRSLLELSLAGLPCVAYDLDWHSEIVEDSVTGFLIPRGSHNKFAEKVIELFKNDAKREDMGKQMLNRAWEKIEREGPDALIKIYEKIISTN
jgi:glycosyltransferase involved in cell wall biosynthesis